MRAAHASGDRTAEESHDGFSTSVSQERRPRARQPRLRAVVRRAHGGSGRGARRKVLIVVFQRGAVDGLNMVVPFGERDYYRARPSIAIAQPGGADGAIDLDGFFGLHPRMAALKPLWDRVSSRSSMPADRPTPRDRISTRRTTWKRHARRQEHAGWLAESLPAGPPARRSRQQRARGTRRFAPSRSRRRCRARCKARARARDAASTVRRARRRRRRGSDRRVVRGAVRRGRRRALPHRPGRVRRDAL